MPRLLTAVISLALLSAAPPASAQSTVSPTAPSASQPVSATHTASDSTAPDASKEEVTDTEPWDRTSAYVHDHADDYVGLGDGHSVYERESAVYRAAPPVRYNRVEGLVVGLQRDPLSLRDPNDSARIYGQLGYAFAPKDLRYTIGIESKLVRDDETGLKVGVAYQNQTLTPDRWKTSYGENSLAGVGFEYDFFDYYEAEGLSVYLVQAFPHTLRLTAGFRSEEHRPLSSNTDRSLFETGTFRANPPAQAG